MLMRTFSITRLSRRCNQLSQVAFAGLALTLVTPLSLIAADGDDAASVQTEQPKEDDKTSSSEPNQALQGTAPTAKQSKDQRSSNRALKGVQRDEQVKSGAAHKGKSLKGMKSGHHRHGEAPELGVIVGSCPGNAVCVHNVMLGSPADDAGLEEGDYILSINDKQVASPEQLREVVEQMKAEDKVMVRVWRQGDERTEEVTLASKAEQPPESHRAWLGVMVAHFDEEGLVVGRVVPGSPAAKAGLQEDDVIQTLNDKQVTDLGAFLECIEDMGPGAEVAIVVDRDGEEQTVKAQLGDIDEAPMAFLREAMQHMAHATHDNANRTDEMSPMLEEAIDELQSRVRTLEKEVKELKGDSSEEDAGNAILLPEPQNEDVSRNSELVDSTQETLVVQRGRGRSYSRGNAFVPNYRGNYYNQTPYSSGYRSGYPSIYRSPGYGNSYYQYGGRPYYYGNYGRSYGYGIRSGIQIGRNFGVYW
jgi:serine protease Do